MNNRKRREDSFFGMHFDFHASKDTKNIGENLDCDSIEEFLRRVKPDFVQCDSKGHPGISSYPTKAGTPAPEIKKDILKVWRELTEKYDVALYAHHSGVWDDAAIERNSEYAAVDADLVPSTQRTSVFGNYADDILIPQLYEIALEYNLDGAWVDGDCWATITDYSQQAQSAYTKKYGTPPPKKDDDNFSEYVDFCREGFLNYVSNYVEKVHKAAPDFQIASNWLYSSYVPVRPNINVDFVSGDYAPNNSLTVARYEGRCLMSQRIPWDLMAWGFDVYEGSFYPKAYEQLCQEAALTISLGGGFQVYNQQICGGSIEAWKIPIWEKLAEFCRAREKYCFRATPISQVAVIFSQAAFFHNNVNLFSTSNTDSIRSIVTAILDSGFSLEVLKTYQALDKKDLSSYGAIVVPNVSVLEPELKEALLNYASKGGNLIIIGDSSAKLFEKELGITINNICDTNKEIHISHKGFRSTLVTTYADVKLNTAIKTGSFLCGSPSVCQKENVASSIVSYEKGNILGVYFDASPYTSFRSASLRDFIGDTILSVFTPAVSVKNSKLVDVVLMKNNDKLCLNLVNIGGNHLALNVKSYDEIPLLYNLEIEISYPCKPKKVMLEPEGISLNYKYEKEKITFVLEKLEIHSIITVE